MRHRGPDDAGYYTGFPPEGGVHGDDGYCRLGLGMRRLSIIDLKTGHQPIYNEDKSIAVILNGEIYNYQGLREELVKKGHRFYTLSDTETIVHLYEEYGSGCLEYLEGMFAFALWDENKKQLFIARDRVGEKPLVYAEDAGGRFYFASEIKALLRIPEIKKEVSGESLHYYFSYIYVPPPLTIYKNIKKLPPSSFMIVSDKEGIKIERYWRCDYSKKSVLSDGDYVSLYRENLVRSVKQRMISDVPLGVMLSGGVDSSSILWAMKEASSSSSSCKIDTFSVGYNKGVRQDEEFLRARSVAKLFGTRHHEIIFEPRGISVMPEILEFYDEPINLFPVVYAYEMMKYIKKYATVVLSGNGADEIFGGYTGYNEILKRHILYEMASHFPAGFIMPFRRLKNFFEIAHLPPSERRAEEFRRGIRSLSLKLYSDNLCLETSDVDVGKPMEDMHKDAGSDDYLDGIMNIDLMLYHSHGHTILPDMSGMANSLEIRAPFLDHKIIEMAASMPRRLKIPSVFNPRLNKYIMKKSMEGILPSEILYGRKMGFGYFINWTSWLRTDWADVIGNILLGNAARDIMRYYFNIDYVKTLLEENISGKKNHSQLIWGLAVFVLWHKKYVEGRDLAPYFKR